MLPGGGAGTGFVESEAEPAELMLLLVLEGTSLALLACRGMSSVGAIAAGTTGCATGGSAGGATFSIEGGTAAGRTGLPGRSAGGVLTRRS